VARRSGLGRGLGALIPGETDEMHAVVDGGGSAYRELPISVISPNRWQPRENFDDEELASLAASITAIGVLQPILVRSLGDADYELIAGERRWRAAQMAGLTSIPALIREAADQSSLEQAVVENLHRSDLNPLEEGAAYQHLIDEFELTQDQVAKRVGKSRSAVTNLLRLFQLPPEVQSMLASGALSAGHGRALLGIESAAERVRMAKSAVAKSTSVRELERQVKGQESSVQTGSAGKSTARSPKKSPPVLKPPALLELEELLEDHLATRVEVNIGSGHGQLVVEFADLDDLERLYLCMVDGKKDHE
jgi:ParB family transcriptional regulator, chromosome partitioning protein